MYQPTAEKNHRPVTPVPPSLTLVHKNCSNQLLGWWKLLWVLNIPSKVNESCESFLGYSTKMWAGERKHTPCSVSRYQKTSYKDEMGGAICHGIHSYLRALESDY